MVGRDFVGQDAVIVETYQDSIGDLRIVRSLTVRRSDQRTVVGSDR